MCQRTRQPGRRRSWNSGSGGHQVGQRGNAYRYPRLCRRSPGQREYAVGACCIALACFGHAGHHHDRRLHEPEPGRGSRSIHRDGSDEWTGIRVERHRGHPGIRYYLGSTVSAEAELHQLQRLQRSDHRPRLPECQRHDGVRYRQHHRLDVGAERDLEGDHRRKALQQLLRPQFLRIAAADQLHLGYEQPPSVQ